ncbi:energy transducer TonB [Marseilla massiliensis]|jgi:protein TonB|uniref:energy transducer TonB n=1 Tax=Marseilla massiliensis TaxID=1841864 RepID=UPI001F931474|nr:energy transducer TonB [Marseilla massiliensis]MCL1610353.1 TonB family protein [Marseilla massiliensis]HIV85057.1 TonB family protein [Candidatus Prevotella intestinigallinarum]
MSKIDLIDNSWVDLVFEGKNHSYGAYRLRKNTGKRNLASIIIVLVAIVVIMAAVWAKIAIENAMPKKVAITTDVELSQLAKKKEAKVERKEPVKIEMEQKVVEKVKSSVKFTAPVIKKDEDVAPEDELKSQDDLAKTAVAIGSFDVKGNDEAAGEVLKAKEVIAQEKPVEEKVFDVVEQMPQFPGGDAALFEYLSTHIKYPTIAEENGVQGRVIVTFVVERDGSITDVKVVKSVDPSLDKEASRVVAGMPKWIPGKQNGSAVRVKYTVPVTFRLQ